MLKTFFIMCSFFKTKMQNPQMSEPCKEQLTRRQALIAGDYEVSVTSNKRYRKKKCALIYRILQRRCLKHVIRFR